MTLAWKFLAQRGYRPLRPGEAPTDAPETWFLRELYLKHYGFAILEDVSELWISPQTDTPNSYRLMKRPTVVCQMC